RRSVLRPSRIRLYEPLVIGTLSVVLALTVWQLVANARIWSVLFLPGPWDVAQAFVQLFQSDDIWLDIATSGEELAIGYGMAIVIGLLIGLLMGWYTRFQYALDPFVNFFYSTPRIVFRLGIGHALTGLVVAEYIAAKHGVGQIIAIASQTFQTPKAFAGVVLIACTGMLLTTVLHRIENRFQSWRPQIK